MPIRYPQNLLEALVSQVPLLLEFCALLRLPPEAASCCTQGSQSIGRIGFIQTLMKSMVM